MTRSSNLPTVTSLGLVTCIGRDVVTAAAAERAGVVRRRPLADVSVFDDIDLEAPVTGAPVEDFLEGFVQTGAWLRLAEAAISDLIRYGRLPSGDAEPAFWKGTAVSWIVPEIEPTRFGWPDKQVPALLDRWAGAALLEIVGLPIRAAPRFLPFGSVGLAAALGGLADQFASGIERVLLLATDSWIDTMSLSWLSGQRRLKTDDNPQGLCPGQAGACGMIERPRGPRTAASSGEGVILGASTETATRRLGEDVDADPEAFRAGAAPQWGAALARCVGEALRSSRTSLPFRGDIYLDLNGEGWKAAAWGSAACQLHTVVDFARSRLRLPAVQTGDIGAASSLSALCFAVRAQVRGYAAGAETLICSLGDSGDTAALVVGNMR